MCGFLVEYCQYDHESTQSTAFQTLLSLSEKRGPDHSEIQSGPFYKLGFNRLSILDLSEKGNQPIYSPSGRYHVVYNGEVYNYKELADEHELHDLRSSSDTEIIVQLFDKIGLVETFNKLNGMFAISVVDKLHEALYISRDFAGIKPFFYGKSEKGVVCASQFDQIYKHPWFENNLHLRPEILKEYFAFGYQQAPNTIYNKIYQLNPGELIRFDRNGSFKKNTIKSFSIDFEDCDDAFSDSSVSDTKVQLKSAVNRQLRSDVPLASFLSGGIDSPLITAIASETKKDLNSFTLGVKNEKINEVQAASNYADHLGITQIIEEISEKELLTIIDEHFKGFPEPFGDYSSIPTFLISKKARQKHTVMLSGDGGDELFYGYPRMLDLVNKRHWFRIPHSFRKTIIPLLIRLKLIKGWGPFKFREIGDWFRSKHCHFPEFKLDQIFPSVEYSDECRNLYTFRSSLSKKNLLKWMRQCEFNGHLQRVLSKVDRMSMANSMEVRIPFLDGEMIKLLKCHVPRNFAHTDDLKSILKSLMLEYYPESMIQEKKKGFAVPINDWLRHELRDDLVKAVLKSPIYGEEMMKAEVLRSHVSDFLDAKHHSGWGVWIIYAWQKWAIGNNFVTSRSDN